MYLIYYLIYSELIRDVLRACMNFSRKDAYNKRKLSNKQINKIYSDWILKNYMKHAEV